MKKLIIAFLIIGLLACSRGMVLETKADAEGVTLSTSVQTYLNASIDSPTQNFSNLTPGTPVTATSTITTTTNSTSGYDVRVARDDADTAMDHDSDATVNITDKTAWDNTADSGNGNAAVWSGTGLGFRVNAASTTATHSSTWWGVDGTPEFAGFPTGTGAATVIMDHNSYSSGSTATAADYKLDVASTQKTGAYSGAITYTITATP